MNSSKELKDIANTIGNFIEFWGFKSIDGKVWSLIYLSLKPISTPEIVDKLGVSKGLVSIAINELIKYQLIKPCGKVEHGAITYTATANIAKTVQKIIKTREINRIVEAEKSLESLAKFSEKELININISTSKLETLIYLTKINKEILIKIVKKKITTVDDWINLLKKYKVFL